MLIFMIKIKKLAKILIIRNYLIVKILTIIIIFFCKILAVPDKMVLPPKLLALKRALEILRILTPSLPGV